jgi:hypothetical protein
MRPHRAAAFAASVGAAVLLAGCSSAQDAVDAAAAAAQDQVRSVTTEAAVAAISGAVQRAASAANVVLDGAPSCRPDLEVDAVEVVADGSVTCSGRSTGGTAYTAAYEGRITTGSCAGTLRLEIDGRAPIVLPEVDGCRIVALVGGAVDGSQP